MFCPNCGTQLPDDARFCAECGSVTTPETPVQTQPKAINPNEGGFFKKDVFFLKRADSKSRTLYFISWGLVFACLLSVILSATVAINGDLLNRPAMNLLNTMSGGMVTEFRSELVDEADYMENIADAYDMDEDEVVRAFSKLANNFSLRNFSNALGLSAEMYEEMGEEGSAIDARETKLLFDIFIAVIVICFLLVGILTALAALFKNFPLAIAAIVLDVGFVAVFSGFLWVLFALAVYIALIVVYVKMGTVYRRARLAA